MIPIVGYSESLGMEWDRDGEPGVTDCGLFTLRWTDTEGVSNAIRLTPLAAGALMGMMHRFMATDLSAAQGSALGVVRVGGKDGG